MRATFFGIVAILAAIGLLVGAVLLYIAARIALAALLFVLFAAVVVWAIARNLQARSQGPR